MKSNRYNKLHSLNYTTELEIEVSALQSHDKALCCTHVIISALFELAQKKQEEEIIRELSCTTNALNFPCNETE